MYRKGVTLRGDKKRGCLMLRRKKSLAAAAATAVTMLGMLAVGPATSAGASTTWKTHVCHGTAKRPGVLTGLNLNVIVRGLCLVNAGPVAVAHDVIITRGSALIAAFGGHDSHISVAGDIIVHRAGTLLLGCEPVHFNCLDEPHPKHPSLASHDTVAGSLVAVGALGVVVHNTWFGHNVINLGGGPGLTCKPLGPFAQAHSPAYTDFEDNWIGGSLWVKHVTSCWLGVIRNWVGGSATVSGNKMKDPDAMEVVTNTVLRDLTCWRNSPKAQFGDSHGLPNRVGLHAFFECGFHRLVPNPAGQHKHFEHISVHLH